MSGSAQALPLAAYVGAAALLTITPGVDTALVLRTAARQGARAAGFAALGVAVGCLVWGSLVAVGLGTLLQAWPIAFDAIRLIGAAYLAWLGFGLLTRPRHMPNPAQPTELATVPAWQQGLLTNLLNPKVGVFYLTFLPQFLPQLLPLASTAGRTSIGCGPTGLAAMTLVAIHVALSLIWFALLIAATVPLGRALARPAVIAGMDRACGAVFIGCAAKLALFAR